MNKTESLTSNSTSIQSGIKLIGVGKNGSEDLNSEISEEISQAIQTYGYKNIQTAVFLSALFMKKVGPSEKAIEDIFPTDFFNNSTVFASHFFAKNSTEYVCTEKVLSGIPLSAIESFEIGTNLFRDQFSSIAKVIIATALRMRHTEVPEYEGIIDAIHKLQYNDIYYLKDDKKISWQISDPFDGMEKSFLLSPIVGRQLLSRNHKVFYLSGKSSGPKFGLNMFKLKECKFINPEFFGDVLDIEEICTSFSKWRELRTLMIKRPFLATLEKYYNPKKLDVIITSVFHPSFREKGNELVQKAGFKAGIVVFKGLEGSIQPSLNRETRMLCSFQKRNGELVEQIFNVKPEDYNIQKQPDILEDKLEVEYNGQLLNQYILNEATQDAYQNMRIKYYEVAFTKPIEWIENQFHMDT